jgi:phosphoglycolate phosphatase
MLTHLLLDLDGTLIDSSPGIYHSFCLACDSLSLKPPSLSDFCSLIGPPIQHIAARLYPHLDQVSLEHFRRVFREDYDRLSYRMAEWYPGVLDSLTVLSGELGIDLAIVTNKPTKPAVELIKHADSYDIFSRIVGIDYRVVHGAGPVFGSKAEALSYVLGSDSFDLSRSAYLGDTTNDRDACETCNLLFIAAVYGFHQWLPEQKPQWCLERFCDIQLLLSSMANQS